VNLADKSVAVLGAGIAGVSAALELAELGVGVELIEKGEFIGGHAALLTCKATDQCLKCNGCLAEERLARVLSHPRIHIRRRSRLVEARREARGWRLRLDTRPAYIDPEACSGCGVCLETCPQPGALVAPHLPGDLPRLAIDPLACLYFRDQAKAMCRDVCPEEAVDLSRQNEEEDLRVDAVIVATGFRPFPAAQQSRWGYGMVPNVITAMELEEQLRTQGRPARPSDGAQPRRVAFLQCVGSRQRGGNNYCSRVCCGYALRLGRRLRDRFETEVWVFYMDLQSFSHAFDQFLAAAREELHLVRSMPYGTAPGPEGRVILEYQPAPGATPVSETFDLVVLSVGIAPAGDNRDTARTLGLGRDTFGFLSPPEEDPQGVFLAGTACGPMDVAESIASAGRAAQQTLHYLEVC